MNEITYSRFVSLKAPTCLVVVLFGLVFSLFLSSCAVVDVRVDSTKSAPSATNINNVLITMGPTPTYISQDITLKALATRFNQHGIQVNGLVAQNLLELEAGSERNVAIKKFGPKYIFDLTPLKSNSSGYSLALDMQGVIFDATSMKIIWSGKINFKSEIIATVAPGPHQLYADKISEAIIEKLVLDGLLLPLGNK